MVKPSSFFLLILATLTLGSPTDLQSLASRSNVGDMFAGTRGLIDNVVLGLQQAATDGGQAVGNFSAGIQEQVNEFREELAAEISRVRETIQLAIANATSNIAAVNTGITECIQKHNKVTQAALGDLVYNVTSCAEGRISRISSLVSELIDITKSAADAAKDVKLQAIECGNGTSNIFTIGSCLGGLLWNAEVKAATITGQSALLIARINLSLGALPATLNICAATKLAQAALSAGFLDTDLAQCSLSAVTGAL